MAGPSVLARCICLACAVVVALATHVATAQTKTKAQQPKATVRFTPAPSAEDQRVMSALRLPVQVSLDGVPLKEAVAQLGQAANVPAEFDAGSLAEMRISAESPVTVASEGRSLEATLWGTLPKYHLDYAVQKGKLVIMGARRASTRPITRTYDLSGIWRPGVDRNQVIRAIIEAGPRPDWSDMGGFATLELDAAKKTATVKHTFSTHAKIVESLSRPLDRNPPSARNAARP